MTITAETTTGEQELLAAIAPARQRLAEHPVYGAVRSLEALRVFLESHVWAVWDFMSLLKSLQRALTCVEVPWVPSAYAGSRRLVNEIVLGEESDVWEGDSLSHFELYLLAMEQAGADARPVRSFVEQVRRGAEVAGLLRASSHELLGVVPEEARAFVRCTFGVIATGAPHRIAAAFTFGREDLIPEMFTSFVRELDREMPGRVEVLRYYLERHIEMDGEDHGPMALAMMRELCPTERHWSEARGAAVEALAAREALWDGILARIHQRRG